MKLKRSLLLPANIVVFLLFMAITITVDGNECVIGLDYPTSVTVVIALFILAFGTAGLMLFLGPSWVERMFAVPLLLLYFVALLPSLWPF